MTDERESLVLRREAQVMPADRRLVGMLMLVCALGGAGFGFGAATLLLAPPIETRQRVQTTCPHHRGAWLGVTITTEEAGGALVKKVNEGSAAETAGVQLKDVIVAIDSVRMRTNDDVVQMIRAHRPGDDIKIVVIRDGRATTLQARLGAQP